MFSISKKVILAGFMLLVSSSSFAEYMWASPQNIEIRMTRGNELTQSSKDFFASQETPQCLENSQPVTVYIQIKGYEGRPKFLTISQLCPESDQLAFLRRVMERKFPLGHQVGIWTIPEPLSSPKEFDKYVFSVRNRAQAEADYQARLQRLEDSLAETRRTLNLGEALTDCYSRTVGAGAFEGVEYGCESLLDGSFPSQEVEVQQ